MVLIFDINGKIVKKYCTNAIPFICGLAQDIDVHLPIISNPITLTIQYTCDGFNTLACQTSRKFF